MTVYQKLLRAAIEGSHKRIEGCKDPVTRAYYSGRADGLETAERVAVRLNRPSVRMKIAD